MAKSSEKMASKSNQIPPILKKTIGKVDRRQSSAVYSTEMIKRVLQQQGQTQRAAPLLNKRILEIRKEIKKALPIAAHVEELRAAMEELAFN